VISGGTTVVLIHSGGQTMTATHGNLGLRRLIPLQIDQNSMNINLWFNKPTMHWRWTLTFEQDTFIMESGQSERLESAMEDLNKTVKWILDSQSNHFAHD